MNHRLNTIPGVLGMVLVALVAVTLSVIGPPLSMLTNFMGLGIGLAVRVALLFLGVFLLYVVWRTLRQRWTRADKDRAPGAPHAEVPQGGQRAQQAAIIDAVRGIRGRYCSASIAMFVRMLTSTRYTVRVTERAEPLVNSMRIWVTTDYAMSAGDRERLEKHANLPVPVLKVSKGTFLDNLDVTDATGASLPVLSQRESRVLVTLALETLFYVTFERALPGSDADIAQQAALWTLRRIVSSTGRIDLGHANAETCLRDELREAVQSLMPISHDRVVELVSFCSFFALNYVVVADVPVPQGTAFVIKYAKTNRLDGHAEEEKGLRTMLGLTPYQFRLPLNLAFSAESYHFRMDMGDGQFVSDHYVDSNGESLSQEQIHKLTGGGYVRVRHRCALPYAHLYARGLNKAQHARHLFTGVKFEETPPGALGATTVVAAVSAVLIAILTFIPPSGNGLDADVSALLLAVPLFAATLVGHSIERVQRSSVTTYVALAITGAIAFVGAAVFGLAPEMTTVENVRVIDLITLPSVNIVGAVLTLVGAGNVFYLLRRFLYRTRRYLDMLSSWQKGYARYAKK